MVDVEIDLNKSVEENAGTYFDLAKKAKKKKEGAKKALEDSKRKLAKLQQEEAQFWEEERKKQEAKQQQRKKEWYEKFHWFISSEGFLCIGGKDATTNEIIIKKNLEKGDLVFHTDAPGSPFFVIKNGQQAGVATKQEAAQAVAIYSRAWKQGHTIADVFSVNPDQVTKEAKSGEFMQKGSFMVYGKKEYYHPALDCGIGIKEGRIIGGPAPAIQNSAEKMMIIVPGEEKKSDLAKKIKYKLGGGELDDIITFLPAGGGEIKKER